MIKLFDQFSMIDYSNNSDIKKNPNKNNIYCKKE